MDNVKDTIQEDSELITNYIKGNNCDFDKLVLKYRHFAVDYAHKICGDYHMAEDTTQNAFADICVHPERYNHKNSFKAYLCSILRNKCVDRFRKRKDITFYDIEKVISYDEGYMNISYIDNMIDLKEGLSNIKKEYKQAIYYIDILGLTHKECGKVMGKTTGGIKVLIHRARKSLKNYLLGR